MEDTIEVLVDRYFTKPGEKAVDRFEFEDSYVHKKRDDESQSVFDGKSITYPKGFSELARRVTTGKYLVREGVPDTGYESDFRRMVDRVVDTITEYGKANGYFIGNETEDFRQELGLLILDQRFAFNSPVWFNYGKNNYQKGNKEAKLYFFDEKENKIKISNSLYDRPQGSACFILKLEDCLEGDSGIKNWYSKMTDIYKSGSGDGSNVSSLRSKGEPIRGGGFSSGVISFMRPGNELAGVVSSGGITRRAAKMVVLDADHPEILEYVRLKADAEIHARALIATGMSPEEAYQNVQAQNQNMSVRLTDDFMHAIESDSNWELKNRTDGKVVRVLKARELYSAIVTSAYVSADPGLQFHDTINDWFTCPNTEKNTATNPCAEYMGVNDSACNLGSVRLTKFVDEKGNFDVKGLKKAIRIATIAQDIIVDYSGYPTEAIAKNSHDLRPLGIGFADLGGMLLSLGIAYDSDEARKICGGITSLLSASAYETSADLAKRKGAFVEYEKNKEPMKRVLRKHQEASNLIETKSQIINLEEIVNTANDTWVKVVNAESYRNSQVSVLAPTGTIGFMMDCGTTGIEPFAGHRLVKNLAGGGTMNLRNPYIEKGLEKLGYSPTYITEIMHYFDEKSTFVGSKLKNEHLDVFDTAMGDVASRRLSVKAHLGMMAAAQLFLSGGISKTVNLPKGVDVEEIWNTYFDAWQLGLKAVAVYADGTKLYQPLNLETAVGKEIKLGRGEIERLKPNAEGIKSSFEITTENGASYNLRVLTFEYPDGRLGEVVIQAFHQGSSVRTNWDNIGVLVSQALKSGAEPKGLFGKLVGTKTEIAGTTDNELISRVTSAEDLIARWLILNYSGVEDYREVTEDYDYELPNGTIPRHEQVKDRIQREVYFDEIKKIQKIMGLTDLEAIKKFDKKHGGTGVIQIMGIPCSKCGKPTENDGKCNKCVSCGITVGGCSA